MSKKSKKSSIKSHFAVGVVQGLLVLVPLIFSSTYISANAQVSGGGTGGGFDSSGGAPTNTADPLTGVEGGGTTRQYFQYHHDNTRRNWRWIEGKGWVLDPTEETYQNGWHWSWVPNEGWKWVQSDSSTSQNSEPSFSGSDVKEEHPGCFGNDGSWVTTGGCAVDQAQHLEASMEDTIDTLMQDGVPEEVAEAMYFARPMTATEHAEVKATMYDAFTGEQAIVDLRSDVQKRASDALRRIVALKDSKEGVRMHGFFVSRGEEALDIQRDIANAETQDELEQVAVHLKKLLEFTAQEVGKASFNTVSSKEIDALRERVYVATEKMLSTLPSAFAAIDAEGISTQDLRRMHEDTLRNFTTTKIRCETQHVDCSRLRDTVEQVEKMVSLIGEIIDDADNAVLRDSVQSALNTLNKR